MPACISRVDRADIAEFGRQGAAPARLEGSPGFSPCWPVAGVKGQGSNLLPHTEAPRQKRLHEFFDRCLPASAGLADIEARDRRLAAMLIEQILPSSAGKVPRHLAPWSSAHYFC